MTTNVNMKAKPMHPRPAQRPGEKAPIDRAPPPDAEQRRLDEERAETGAGPDANSPETTVTTGAHSAASVEKKGCGCSGSDEDSTRDMAL